MVAWIILVIINKFRRSGRIGHDPCYHAGHQKNKFRPIGPEPIIDRRLIAQVQLLPAGVQDLGETFFLEVSKNRRADQTSMAGHINAGISYAF